MNRKEAINVVKCNWPEGRHQLSEALKTLIPEFQESEDERIRKRLVEYFNGFYDRFFSRNNVNVHWNGLEVKAVIAYLEKQKDEAQKQFNLGIQAGKEEALYEMEKEQKPAEQSEDERIRKEIVGFIDNVLKDKNVLLLVADRIGDNIPSMIPDWIAYLERQKEQKSIEDVIKNINKNKEAATKFLKSAGIMDDNGELAEMYRSEQKSTEWSKLDKLHQQNIIAYLEFRKDKNLPEDTKYPVLDAWIDWLKSLSPQPHWKPSKEQMDALDNIASAFSPKNKEYKTVMKHVNTLRDDLKML